VVARVQVFRTSFKEGLMPVVSEGLAKGLSKGLKEGLVEPLCEGGWATAKVTAFCSCLWAVLNCFFKG
jgi:hypothetical protein